VDTKVNVKFILIATIVTININKMFFETRNDIVFFYDFTFSAWALIFKELDNPGPAP
jgi:hypothetical protein